MRLNEGVYAFLATSKHDSLCSSITVVYNVALSFMRTSPSFPAVVLLDLAELEELNLELAFFRR